VSTVEPCVITAGALMTPTPVPLIGLDGVVEVEPIDVVKPTSE
jgi:hypothetical protein